MAEMIWKIGFDKLGLSQLKKANSKAKKESKSGASAFGGALIGGLIGSLLSSVKSLFEPLSAIATLLVTALFPILKPFLILFIKVGLLLYKFLNKALGTTSDVAGIAGKDDEGTTKVGELGKKIALWTGIAIAAIVAVILAIVGGLPAVLIGGIALIVAVIWKYIVEAFIWAGAKIVEGVKWLIEVFPVIIEWIKTAWSNFVDWLGNVLTATGEAISKAWKSFLGMLEKSWDFLKNLGKTIWDSIVTALQVAWDFISGIGQAIWDSMIDVIQKSLSVLSNIGTWIKNSIKEFFGFGKNGSSKSVNDAIISPNGDIIRTNPSDYLIATKSPSALMGGGSGGASTINVNISGGLITEDVAKDIGNIIMREINNGGGF